jgi:hypothetical protein
VWVATSRFCPTRRIVDQEADWLPFIHPYTCYGRRHKSLISPFSVRLLASLIYSMITGELPAGLTANMADTRPSSGDNPV